MNMLYLIVALVVFFCLLLAGPVIKRRARNRRDLVLQYMEESPYGEVGQRGTLKNTAKRLEILTEDRDRIVSIMVPKRGRFSPGLLGKIFGSILYMENQDELYEAVAKGLYGGGYTEGEIDLFLLGAGGRRSQVAEELRKMIDRVKTLDQESIANYTRKVRKQKNLQKGLRACGVKEGKE
jgi:hypothetical protein